MSDLAHERMELYSALAEALKYPNMALLGEEHFLLNALGKFSEEVHAQAIQSEAKKLARWLNDLPKVTPLGQLEVEYNRLFCGPFAPLVYPYESVYLDADGLVMGQSAVAVLEQYREVGLAISPEFKDLPDHIVVELEFMAYLCAKEAEAHALKPSNLALEYLCKERDFIKKHLNVWVFTFCDRIIATSKSVFYPCLARILSAYLRWEERYVTTQVADNQESGKAKNFRATSDLRLPKGVELASCISCGKPYIAKTVLAEILEKLSADAATESLRHATMCCPRCKRMSLSVNTNKSL